MGEKHMVNHQETIQVRPGEELNLERLEPYLRREISALGDAPLEISQFAAGKSNLTYLIRCGEWEGVLRRPPLGPVAPKAHDMEREFHILELVNPVFPLAPKPYVFCNDTSLVGSQFYVMERKHGVVLDEKFPQGVEPTPDLCRNISYAVVDTLVALHEVDYKAAGMAHIGHPEGYLERQVRGWVGRYERAKTDDIPEMDKVAKWLIEHLPASPAPAIVHNDYKLNNMMLSHDLDRIVGVFDWEMTTIGDPLADLGAVLTYWTLSTDPEEWRQLRPSVTMTPGFISREEFVERYASKSGRDVSNINYYWVFGYIKLAGIIQQIYYRWKRGQTRDSRFANMGKVVRHLIKAAADRI
jgi:aminoglycoside phosphotransferase (APT) family kinase protein